MGQKQSRRLQSIPEITEIIELTEDSTVATTTTTPNSSCYRNVYLNNCNNNREMNNFDNYPNQFKEILMEIDEIDRNINEMTRSEIHLYYATFKDDLHNNWQKIYNFKIINNNNNNNVEDNHFKQMKIEIIERIKHVLQQLNDRVLKQ